MIDDAGASLPARIADCVSDLQAFAAVIVGKVCRILLPVPWRPRGGANRDLRRRVFSVYGRRCSECGAIGVPLEVHHVNGDPTDNAIRNTIPLCADCHRSPEMHG